MAGIKIDGKVIAQSVKDRVKKAVEELKSQGISPCLATILVGDNSASATYVRNKHKACEEIGIITKDHKLDANISQTQLNEIIENLNTDSSVHGILIQLPLPKQIDEFATTSRISPLKDVFLPKVIGKNIEFRKITNFSSLEKGSFDIMEPKD